LDLLDLNTYGHMGRTQRSKSYGAARKKEEEERTKEMSQDIDARPPEIATVVTNPPSPPRRSSRHGTHNASNTTTGTDEVCNCLYSLYKCRLMVKVIHFMLQGSS
jgi:hypothetical protein